MTIMAKNLFFVFMLIAWSMTIYLGMRYYLGRALRQQQPKVGVSDASRQQQEMSDRASQVAERQRRFIEQNQQKMQQALDSPFNDPDRINDQVERQMRQVRDQQERQKRMMEQQRMMQENQKRMMEMRTR